MDLLLVIFLQKCRDSAGFWRRFGIDGLRALSSGVTTEALKWGVDLAFGSFTSRREPTVTTTERNTRFTSSEIISVVGTLEMGNAAEVRHISSLPVPGTLDASNSTVPPLYNELLGVWNLRNAPVVRMSDATHWFSLDMYPGLGHAGNGRFFAWGMLSRNFYLDRVCAGCSKPCCKTIYIQV